MKKIITVTLTLLLSLSLFATPGRANGGGWDSTQLSTRRCNGGGW